MAIHRFHIDQDGVMTPIISRDARLVVGPQAGATTAVMNYVVLQPGEANQPHIHRDSEDTVFILEGQGQVTDFDNGTVQPIEAGCAVFVPPGVRHAIAATGTTPMVSVGGPCPPDYDLLRACGITWDRGQQV